MSSPASSNPEVDIAVHVKMLEELSQKAKASLLPAAEEHIRSTEYDAARDGLDFLETKNALTLSYLIELTLELRNKLQGGDHDDQQHRHRLVTMKTALDKMRGLGKKLRYQIDKLLAAGSSAAFATAEAQEDPLQYRPSIADDDKSTASSSSSDSDGDLHDNSNSGDEDIDNDLAAACKTVVMARNKQQQQRPESDDGVYRAPKLAAVPYTHDKVDRQVEQERREKKRMRASELAQTMRAQYGEMPEQEDIHGGSEMGKQREAARRLAAREDEKTRYEEDFMIRLTTTRKEKKDRKRLMREEGSNLAAIANLKNIVRDVEYADRRDRRLSQAVHEPGESTRHANGKRKRQKIDREGRPLEARDKRHMKHHNELQSELYGGSRSNKKGGKMTGRR